MLRLFHTSDWHLGHSLHDHDQAEDHDAFLAWLLDRLDEHRPDALLISGDVFDVAHPSATSTAQWYRFLARARACAPRLDIVAIAGNHDSGPRLDAPGPILRELGVRIVGRLPRESDGALRLDDLVLPLRDAEGKVAAWCLAIPYLRPADLPSVPDGGDPLIDGVAAIYTQATQAALARRQPGQALIALGHLYMQGGQLSELSERKILGGNLHALPDHIFPPELGYVALGHLHRAQAVGRSPHHRYAGSPIPLALDEADYPHQVRLVELEGEVVVRQEALRVPRHTPILRVPAQGAAPLAELGPLLRALPPAQTTPKPWPLLEVHVRLDGPQPGLRAELDGHLDGRAARLARIAVERAGAGGSLAEGQPGRALADLSVEQVLIEKWRRDHDQPPPDAVLRCLHELLDELHQEAP